MIKTNLMHKILNLKGNSIAFAAPLLLIGIIVFLSQSKTFTVNPDSLSLGITLDLLLTVPLIYFLLIRNKDIPNITVVPFFVAGVIIASFILPEENQYYLNLAKTWVLPVVELGILTLIIIKVRKATKYFIQIDNPDFFTALKGACAEALPKQVVVPFAFEIGVFYYAFVDWKKRRPNKNEFTYHKDSGSIALLATILFLVIFETIAIHLLLAKWSDTAAWIMTGLSIFSGYQVLGFLKSLSRRPITITDEYLNLYCGILSEAVVPLKDIEKVELSSKFLDFDQSTRPLSPLGKIEGHNVVITLQKEHVISGFYGIKRKFRTLALHVDQKEEFKAQIEARKSQLS
ncbi:MAG: hypothetical protein RIA63_04790 [Cyclobacteriaceae bacterium]